jgi:hypothetical protein
MPLRTLEALLKIRAELLFLGTRKLNGNINGRFDFVTFCCHESSKFFDGFHAVWQIPKRVDDRNPKDKDTFSRKKRLLDQQHGLLHSPNGAPIPDLFSSVRALMEQEVEQHCADEWDIKRDMPGAVSMSWTGVRHEHNFCDLADMLARSRLRRQEILLPEYLKINVLDINDDGRIMACTRVIPKDIPLRELIIVLERWRPEHCPRHGWLIQSIQRTADAVHLAAADISLEVMEEAKRLKTHLHRPWFT